MQYKDTPGLARKFSNLSLGTNRLPEDEDEAIKLIKVATENGVNLIDTSAVYGDGRAEKIIGKALQGLAKENTMISTKLPTWQVEGYLDMDRILFDQLERLSTDTIDFYLLHALNWQEWKRLGELEIGRWIETHRGSEFKHLGFSYAGSREGFRNIVNAGHFDLTMVQLNWLDYSNLELARHAYWNDLAVATLRPLREGALARPNSLADWTQLSRDMGPVERSLNWLWHLDTVSTVTVGTGDIVNLRKNIKYAARSRGLEVNDRELFADAQRTYYHSAPITCYGCGDCLPCPEDVWIERNFQAYNDSVVLGADENRTWEHLEGHSFDQCTDCGICTERCPAHFDIYDKLKETKEHFEES